ncbi:hypothetical protein [Roseibium aggregatum]|uniref:hypothetical protein n=1 Tax=Roseibium aggregatum TaxID=187304 RepID=UPI003A97C80C
MAASFEKDSLERPLGRAAGDCGNWVDKKSSSQSLSGSLLAGLLKRSGLLANQGVIPGQTLTHDGARFQSGGSGSAGLTAILVENSHVLDPCQKAERLWWL